MASSSAHFRHEHSDLPFCTPEQREAAAPIRRLCARPSPPRRTRSVTSARLMPGELSASSAGAAARDREPRYGPPPVPDLLLAEAAYLNAACADDPAPLGRSWPSRWQARGQGRVGNCADTEAAAP